MGERFFLKATTTTETTESGSYVDGADVSRRREGGGGGSMVSGHRVLAVAACNLQARARLVRC